MPIGLDEAKRHLRVDDDISDDDALIAGLIAAVTAQAENDGWLSCCTQSWTLYLSAWPDEPLLLPRHPIQSIVSVKYYDASDVAQTVVSSVYMLTPAPGLDAKLWLKHGQQWPTAELSERQYPIEVEYVTGFGADTAVPQPIKAWMLLRLAALYENREAALVVPGVSNAIKLDFVDGLLEPYRGFRY